MRGPNRRPGILLGVPAPATIPPRRRVATFSIVASDGRDWGVAVASKFLAVGNVVPAAAAGVGAVATQATANTTYRAQGLDLLRRGHPAADVVAALTGADPGRDHRQLGVVDAQGGGATFTGQACLAWAGGRTGPGYAAQGNILQGPAVVNALAETFEAAGGDLAARLLAALAAGDLAGGDRRGRQSAALLVVRLGAGYGGGDDRMIDLRVDDHPAPVAELDRLTGLWRLYFETAPAADLLPVDVALTARIGRALAARGRLAAEAPETVLWAAFDAWVGEENLEERAPDHERIDPVVLARLEDASGAR